MSQESGFWKEILVSKYGGWRNLRSQACINKESIWWRDLEKVWKLVEWGNDFKDKGRWV